MDIFHSIAWPGPVDARSSDLTLAWQRLGKGLAKKLGMVDHPSFQRPGPGPCTIGNFTQKTSALALAWSLGRLCHVNETLQDCNYRAYGRSRRERGEEREATATATA
jgi:hypothetical protein